MRVLAVLAALIIPLAVYYPVFQERQKTIETAEKEITELDKRIEQARSAQRKLPQFREELHRLDVENEKLRRILPPDLALNDLRAIVETIAADSGLHLERFQPHEPKKGESIELAIDTEATGSIQSIARFFDSIRNSSRIINASYITLQKTPAGEWQTKFLMTTFSLP
jgi:Tfp pilus assembly protein PilO